MQGTSSPEIIRKVVARNKKQEDNHDFLEINCNVYYNLFDRVDKDANTIIKVKAIQKSNPLGNETRIASNKPQINDTRPESPMVVVRSKDSEIEEIQLSKSNKTMHDTTELVNTVSKTIVDNTPDDPKTSTP